MKPATRAALFFLPLAVVLGVPGLVLGLSGELTNPDTVVQRQTRDDRLVLHGVAYTNSALYVKVRHIKQRKPRVLALGNSRVLQFRRAFFRDEARFYNAGGTVAKIMNFRDVLSRLPQRALPEILLIATDTGYFHPAFDQLDRDQFNTSWVKRQMNAHPEGGEVFFQHWRDVWSDLRAGKIAAAPLLGLRGLTTHIGLSAVSRGQGFRNDGSYLYPPVDLDITQPQHRDYAFANTLKSVTGGKGRFPWGEGEPSEPHLRELEALLDFCRERGIHVCGFLPLHAHAVWSAMQAQGEKYRYVWDLPDTLRPRFESRGFEFYDFSDFALLDAPDSEAIDGFHGSERTHLRLLIAMLEKGSRLNAYANLPELRAALASATTHTDLFPAHF